MINLFNYLLISNIFTGSFILPTGLFDFYINYIFMAFFLLFYIFHYRTININRTFAYVLILFIISSFLNTLYLSNPISSLVKPTIGFIFYGIVYYLLVRINNYNVEKLFRVYLQLAFVVALIGIFQEISFFIGFEYGYDFRYFIPRIVNPQIQSGMLRVTSIMQEPTHFGTAMIPAFFISVLNILERRSDFISKKASFLIIISTLLTFSLVVYVGIVAAFILIMLNYRNVRLIVACAVILVATMFISYRYLPIVKMKVSETVAVISGKKPLNSVNLSTFAFCSNGFIAYKSFMRNPLFGSGLGSHPTSYDRYIAQIINPAEIWCTLNRDDASGLFFRLISETGLLGTFLFLYFIIKFYVSRKKDNHLWAISNSIVCLFILSLLRQGNYFYGGLIFFVFMYYFVNKNMSLKVGHDH